MVQEMTSASSCLLVDDSRPILDALSQLLVGEGCESVTTAETGAEALEALEQHDFDAVILDYRLPDISGLEVARGAAEISPSPILFYTSYADPAFVLNALEAGARAIVLKDAPPANLLQALSVVADGDVYLDPRLTSERRRCGR